MTRNENTVSSILGRTRIDVRFYKKTAPGIPEFRFFGRLQHTGAEEPLPDHVHTDVMEICYLLRGRQEYVVGNETFELAGGDVFVTFPGEVHGTGAAPEEKSIMYWVGVDLPGSKSGRARFLELPPAEGRFLANRLRSISPRLFKGSREMKRILDEIIVQYYLGKKAFKWSLIRTALQEFLIKVAILGNRGFSETKDPSRPIRNAIDLVIQNLGGSIGVPDMARVSGLSESRFKTRFRDEVGMPPGEFILRKKIEKAQEMLASRKHSVTDVAYHLGFSSSQYFATAFKRITGKRPREWKWIPETKSYISERENRIRH